MKIEVITTYYREEFLAPLFLMHYEPWVDKVTFLTCKFSDGKFDDEVKSGWINEAIARSDADWLVVVDMDEFVFPAPLGTNARQVLENETGDIINSEMVRVWRHRGDQDIDRLQPPALQRTHGQADHIKPCIFRPRGVTLGIGNHSSNHPANFKWGSAWSGVHWANADSQFWIDRHIRDRGERLSQRNIAGGQGTHTLRNREQILAECNAHLDDPPIIAL